MRLEIDDDCLRDFDRDRDISSWVGAGRAAGDRDRGTVRPHRTDADHWCQSVPRIPRLYEFDKPGGGVEGYRIKADEIDVEYKVPPAVEAYGRQKLEGAVSIMLYGTPQTQALTQKLNEDNILRTSPGFGTAAAANGARYPYLFPIAATYWAQGAAAIKFVKEKLGGGLEGKKIAYLFFLRQSGRSRALAALRRAAEA